MRARSRWRRSITRRFADLDLAARHRSTCTSRFPAASMPAATITSAISAFSASRRTARSSTRSRSAAVPTRRPSSARCSVRRFPTARSPTWSRTSSPPISSCARGPSEIFLDTVKPHRRRAIQGACLCHSLRRGRIVEDRYVRMLDDAPLPEGRRCCCRRRGFSPTARISCRAQAPIGVLWPNDRKVAELAPLSRPAGAGRAGVPDLQGRPRLQPGAAVARALRLSRRAARHRRSAARPVSVSARAGFDSFEVKKDADAAAFRRGLQRYSVFYQPTGDGRLSARNARASRLVPTAAFQERPEVVR